MKKMSLILTVIFACSIFSSCQDKGETLYFYNWQEYIDPEVVEMFTEETGINVVVDPFETNESMYVKIARSGGYDVILPSEYMAQRMINEGLLETINMDNIPNYVNIDDNFKGMFFDPNNEYFVPYMWGTVGIMYDSARVLEPVTSWDALWDERYAGEIFMYDSVRDTMTAALRKLGYSINSESVEELDQAVDLLLEQKPLVQAYLGEPVKDKMIVGEGILAIMYSGDAQFCQFYNEDLKFAIPEEGSNIFVDGLVIPKSAKNKEGAEKFIDFLCRPEIAAMNSEYIGYTTANSAALPLIDPELAANPIFWASDEEIARCEFFRDLGDFRQEYDRAWTEAKMVN